MALAYVRSSTNNSGATTAITVTYSTVPANNNLLVAVVTHLNDLASSWTTPTGWTRAVEKDTGGTAGNPICGTVIFYKIAATEGTAQTFGSSVSTIRKLATILEFSGNSTTGVLDVTAVATAGVGIDATSQTTGTTAATANVNEVAVAVAAIGKSTSTVPVWSAWTNTYTSAVNLTFGGTANVTSHNVAYKFTTGAAIREATAAWTPGQRAVGLIATFKEATPPIARTGTAAVTNSSSSLTATGTKGALGTATVSQQGFMALIWGYANTYRLQQSIPVAVQDATSISSGWPMDTATGSLCLACIATRNDVTITPPAGWTAHTRVAGTPALSVFYIPNAASRNLSTQPELFTWTGVSDAVLQLLEIVGVVGTTPIDVSASSTGSTALASTGVTGTQTQASEYVFGAFAATGVETFGAPANAFSPISNASSANVNASNRVSLGTIEQHASTVAARSSTSALSATRSWAGVLIGFKGASSVIPNVLTGTGEGNAVSDGIGVGGAIYAAAGLGSAIGEGSATNIVVSAAAPGRAVGTRRDRELYDA